MAEETIRLADSLDLRRCSSRFCSLQEFLFPLRNHTTNRA